MLKITNRSTVELIFQFGQMMIQIGHEKSPFTYSDWIIARTSQNIHSYKSSVSISNLPAVKFIKFFCHV